ncbi:MAG: trehalose-phosphatase [Hyphomicrobium sp.]|nr:trehalose-phosphatase [Hyphomicrobium sp.]
MDLRPLKTARDDLLLLDLDGTVIDIAPLPGEVWVDGSLKSVLHELFMRDPLGLVIVTGRSLSDADRMLTPIRLPAIASHGAEVRVAGTAAASTGALSIRYLKPALEAVLNPFVTCGAIVEWKPYSSAVHVRTAPELAGPVLEALRAFVERNRSYRVQPGPYVFEVLPAGVAKATAVSRLMQHLPYAGRRPVFIGDDCADHDAMREVERVGGTALKVAGEYFPISDSHFASTADVRAWLMSRAREETSGTASDCSRCISE